MFAHIEAAVAGLFFRVVYSRTAETAAKAAFVAGVSAYMLDHSATLGAVFGIAARAGLAVVLASFGYIQAKRAG